MQTVIITGGAGFIGSNLATYLSRKHGGSVRVICVDDLSREASRIRAKSLRAVEGVELFPLDVRDPNTTNILSKYRRDEVSAIVHLAGQVSAIDAEKDPVTDAEVNVGGTMRMVQLARSLPSRPIFIFASSNKVYGDRFLSSVSREIPYIEDKEKAKEVSPRGVYGHSKHYAERYIAENLHCHAILRMSCIYGENQYGEVGQGWVSHAVNTILGGSTPTIFGSGHQVRDLLHVSDWCRLVGDLIAKTEYHRLEHSIFMRTYDVGGGQENVVTVRKVFEYAHRVSREVCGEKIGPLEFVYEDERPRDQRWYVTDLAEVYRDIGWYPNIHWRDGVRSLVEKTAEAKGLLLTPV